MSTKNTMVQDMARQRASCQRTSPRSMMSSVIRNTALLKKKKEAHERDKECNNGPVKGNEMVMTLSGINSFNEIYYHFLFVIITCRENVTDVQTNVLFWHCIPLK